MPERNAISSGETGQVTMSSGHLPWPVQVDRLRQHIACGGQELCQSHETQHSQMSEHNLRVAAERMREKGGWGRRLKHSSHATVNRVCILSYLKGI